MGEKGFLTSTNPESLFGKLFCWNVPDVRFFWLLRLYLLGMDFDQQIAQADQLSAENLINHISSTDPRISIDEMPEKDIDQLPFGAIQLDTNGRVLKYNDFESRLAGVKKVNAVGKNFFTEVAPCTNVKEFYGRFRTGVDKGVLHEKFRYHFSFKKNPIDVTVTLFYSDITKSIWVFVRPV